MNREENILTVKAVLLYIIENSNTDRHDVYSIVKTAYYAQQFHFVRWALPLYHDNIAALPFGPVPSALYNVLKLARGETKERGFLKESGLDVIAKSIGFENEAFSAKEPADLSVLTPAAIGCLDDAIAKVAAMDFGSIVRDTHGVEWNRVRNSADERFMNNLNIAREGGASEEAVQYLSENMEWDRMFS